MGVDFPPSRCVDEVGELCAHVVSFRRKTGDGETNATNVGHVRARAIEDVDSRMLCESDLRNATAFVIAGDDEDRDAFVGNAGEWLECLPGDARRWTRAVEYVTAVNDEIDVAVERGLQRRRVVCEKIMAAPASLDARPRRQVEAEVGVSEKEDADAFGHGGKIDAGAASGWLHCRARTSGNALR